MPAGSPYPPPPMRVVATAGGAGHGKSTLVRALTGRDRWAKLPSGHVLALLDNSGEGIVPGLATAVRTGLLLRLADGVYLAPDAVERAESVLRALPQPFTVAAARTALRTSRRVAVPLLELMDTRGITARLPDSRRRIRPEHD
ncbi:ABC-type glutathione transport system ATPase component [Crossiella equi]|uniref:ABC-type glutathione transport system ATPase component n=1 Tax=Crossiella equi TaxID=130796 RepID=A0ABS5AR79_9PSEU|nr:SelB C-terminal domain-containing protein [Crossiella equi]MBP2478757.1 ABC-type glutathione transport system ATPase component [Crossiella equi]